jgi:hypothetical protein
LVESPLPPALGEVLLVECIYPAAVTLQTPVKFLHAPAQVCVPLCHGLAFAPALMSCFSVVTFMIHRLLAAMRLLCLPSYLALCPAAVTLHTHAALMNPVARNAAANRHATLTHVQALTLSCVRTHTHARTCHSSAHSHPRAKHCTPLQLSEKDTVLVKYTDEDGDLVTILDNGTINNHIAFVSLPHRCRLW